MKTLSFALLSFAAFLALTPGARAAGTSPPPPPRPAQQTEMMPATHGPADSTAVPGRAQAEKAYAKGWEISEEAKKELAAGKSDSAKKKFGKALKKFSEATDIDPAYFEAWNMVGFCSRKSGDLKRAFAAYEKCLVIQPEYEPAHEYLGEAYLMSGDRGKAKEQLAWLVGHKSKEAGELATKIEAFEKGGGQADSTSQGGGW
jgi:tetratricopeptide (TPR) repeat protein